MKIINVNNLTKTFGKLTALNNISFEVEQGEMFGVIGADGAGKTTLFRILTSLMLADSGTATLNHWDTVNHYREIRRHIGYMPGKFSLYQDMTVEENLSFYATVFHTTIAENEYLIKDIYQQIEPFKNRRAGKLSGGMKQKLALCCALIHQPLILFLDEPTTGIDPVSRKELWDMLKKLKAQGITIVVSTPYMDEAVLCDRIALIQQGKMLKIDTPANMAANYPKKLYAVELDNHRELLKTLRNHPAVHSVYSFGQSLHVTFNDLPDHSFPLKQIAPTVEDVFMQLTENENENEG